MSDADDSPEAGPQLPSGQLYQFAWTFYLLLAIAGLVWIGVRERGIALSLFVEGSRWGVDLAIGVGAALAMLGVWEVAYRLSASARNLSRLLAAIIGALPASEVVALALLSGFAEELFFRGAVQGAWGWAWATVIFAILHTGPGRDYRAWTLFAAVAGGALGALMLWRGNLLAPIVAHAAFNAFGLARLSREARSLPSASLRSDDSG